MLVLHRKAMATDDTADMEFMPLKCWSSLYRVTKECECVTSGFPNKIFSLR